MTPTMRSLTDHDLTAMTAEEAHRAGDYRSVAALMQAYALCRIATALENLGEHIKTVIEEERRGSR